MCYPLKLAEIYHGNELCKYADDTYLIVPASNVDTRTAELNNITDRATINNLSLNLSKSEEIPFHRFISGNEAHIQKPDDTNSRHEEDRKCTERTIKTQKTQNTQ